MSKLLVVDDEAIICQSFRWIFASGAVEVLTAGSLEEGWRLIDQDQPDVVVLDLQLPDGSGLDLFERIRFADPRRPVIFITAHGTTETAIEAMKRGAFEYLTKPLDLEQITRLLARAFEAARLMHEPAALPDDPVTDRIVGRTPVIQEMCKQIGRVAPQEVTVLIVGESGTGKELVARAIYQHSKRSDRPFLAINCAALPESLVESELFGHEAGAFTGADRRRIGKFEQCQDGTLLLDEIGDMPLSAQAKILRLLQDQTFERVGGSERITTHVRVIAATNQNLEHLITIGRFRLDLYHRLKEVTISVPPLRERKEDIPELAQHFLDQFTHASGRDVRGFTQEVLKIFASYSWPGNVRELRGVIKDATLRSSGQLILTDFLPLDLSRAFIESPTKDTGTHSLYQEDQIESLLRAGERGLYSKMITSMERELITRVLRYTHGHQGQASDILGMDRKTLRNKIRELGLTLDKIVINPYPTDSTED